MNKIDLRTLAGYDEDFALWAAEQGALIRAGKLDKVDLENVAEEIESLGRSDKYQIASRMEVLLLHLLKWEFQPEKRTNSWKATIVEQRLRISDLIEESPSLKAFPATKVDSAYVMGLNAAITETQLPEDTFPGTCPYTIEQILDRKFFPGDL